MNSLKFFWRWFVPEIVKYVYRFFKNKLRTKEKDPCALKDNGLEVNKNLVFKDIHKNERCFIIGSGPSINNQDFTPLKNEICFALNKFPVYYKDFHIIKPQYCVFSGIVHHKKIPYDVGLDWYKLYEQKISFVSKPLLNFSDKGLIDENNLFPQWKPSYFKYSKDLKKIFEDKLDGFNMYGSQNVTIMAIQIAFFMGFKEIFLVGMDHNWIKERALNHFYSNTEDLFLKTGKIDNYFEKLTPTFNMYSVLWNQYELVNQYSRNIGVSIFDATKNGLLDVFPKVEYDSLF